jgi:predicted NBD/HSP70 family sugar kinase
MRVSDTRQANRRSVLRELITYGPASQADIARRTGISKPTVSRIVNELAADGLVRGGGAKAGGSVGRPGTELEFATDVGLVCGVDLGATNTRLVVSHLGGPPLASERHPTPQGLDDASLADWFVRMVTGMCERHADGRSPWATCVGVPGVVHPDTDEIVLCPNLPGIGGTGFAEGIRAGLGSPVVLNNDANVALLGELSFGAARNRRSAVMFTIGTGLGCGVVVDGRLVRGRTGFVGEFGYVPIGLSGDLTLEGALGAPSIVRRAASRGIAIESAAEVFQPSASPVLQELRDDAATALVTACAAAAAAYEPEVVVLTGGVADSIAPQLPRLRERLRAAIEPSPDIVMAECGDLAGALGAMAEGVEVAFRRLGLAAADSHPPTWAAHAMLGRHEPTEQPVP